MDGLANCTGGTAQEREALTHDLIAAIRAIVAAVCAQRGAAGERATVMVNTQTLASTAAGTRAAAERRRVMRAPRWQRPE